MTATIELNSARRKLQNALADNSKTYFMHLRSWFRKRLTKEEFDVEAKKLLANEFHTHNEFLLAILNKCQTLANFTLMTSPTVKTPMPSVLSPTTSSIGSPGNPFSFKGPIHHNIVDNGRLKQGPVKKRNKSNRPSYDHRFSPASPDHLTNCDDLEPNEPEERNLMFAFKEPTLPDASMIGGRLLIAAWEEGLDGSVNDPAATELIVAAVDQLLRNIIMSLLIDKTSYKLSQDKKTPHSVGSATSNPYLITKQRSDNLSVEHSKSNNGDDELSTIWEMACAHRQSTRDQFYSQDVTLYDLLATLKKHRTLIPSHSVYSINMERLICRLNHE